MTTHLDMPDNVGECPTCGDIAAWYDCPHCGGAGGFDGETLMEEDPLWYDEDSYLTCDWCEGKGGHWHCPTCTAQKSDKETREYEQA